MSKPTNREVALVTHPSQTPLRESLVRLDAAARARLLAAGDDVEHVVTNVSARLEARARASLREGLRANAWLALGLAVGLGLILGRGSRRR